MKADFIARACARIGDLTPMESDCGGLCGKACCAPDEDGLGGMDLFPGEEALFMGETWCHIVREDGRAMLVCDGPCPRDKRPLACRIFPLTPVFSKGAWNVRLDARARSMCPLTAWGIKGLKRDFCLAVRDAMRIIAEDPEGEAFLRWWQMQEEPFRNFTL